MTIIKSDYFPNELGFPLIERGGTKSRAPGTGSHLSAVRSVVATESAEDEREGEVEDGLSILVPSTRACAVERGRKLIEINAKSFHVTKNWQRTQIPRERPMKALKVGVTCLAVLGSLALVRAQSSPQPAAVRNATPLSARHINTFDLATYRELEKTDRRALGLILIAMRETVFYAQKSIGRPVICASPKPIPATELIKRVDKEIAAPSNPVIHRYTDNDQLAFIFVSAMKNANFCD